MKLVTIILPTYNRIATFKDALESARVQAYGALEILVLDNSENNNVLVHLENISDSRVKLVKHPANIGAVLNITYGFCIAQGQYVCLLGDDDIMDPNFVSTGVSHLEKNTAAIGISFAYDVLDVNGKTITMQINHKKNKILQQAQISDLSNKNRKINFCASLFRSCVKERVKRLYWAGLGLDTALLAELICDEKLLYENTTLFKYRVHQGQTSHNSATESIRDEINVYNRILQDKNISPLQRRELKNNLTFSYICLRDKLISDKMSYPLTCLRDTNIRLLELDPMNLKRWLPLLLGTNLYRMLRKGMPLKTNKES